MNLASKYAILTDSAFNRGKAFNQVVQCSKTVSVEPAGCFDPNPLGKCLFGRKNRTILIPRLGYCWNFPNLRGTEPAFNKVVILQLGLKDRLNRADRVPGPHQHALLSPQAKDFNFARKVGITNTSNFTQIP